MHTQSTHRQVPANVSKEKVDTPFELKKKKNNAKSYDIMTRQEL